MKDVRSISFGVVAAAVVPGLALTHAVRADELADLASLAQAEGGDYVRMRTALIEQHRKSWDIAAAAAHSWESALAAYILNERMAEARSFKRLDSALPRHSREVNGYGTLPPPTDPSMAFRIDPDAYMAFLLEKLWKAPNEWEKPPWGITPERDRQYAYNTLLQASHGGSGVGDTALWKAMWEEAEDERFKYVAIGPLCADPDASVQPIIRAIIHGEDILVAGYKAKARCLGGLGRNPSEPAKDFVLEAWGQLKSEALAIRTSSRGVLASSSNPAARQLLYALALDPAESPTARRDIVSALGHHRQPSDRAFLAKFFSEVESQRLRREVLNDIARWFPLEMYGGPVREILKSSSDRKLLLAAVGALARGYKAPLPLLDKETGEWDWGGGGSPAYREYRRKNPRPTPRIQHLDLTAWEEDVALLNELAAREDLPDRLRGQIERNIAGMHELRRRFESQPPGD